MHIVLLHLIFLPAWSTSSIDLVYEVVHFEHRLGIGGHIDDIDYSGHILPDKNIFLGCHNLHLHFGMLNQKGIGLIAPLLGHRLLHGRDQSKGDKDIIFFRLIPESAKKVRVGRPLFIFNSGLGKPEDFLFFFKSPPLR